MALPSPFGRKLGQRQILVVVVALITVTLLFTGGLDAGPVHLCPRSAEGRPKFDIEPYGVQGPLRWTDLPPSVQSDFTLGGVITVQDGYFPANAADTRPKPWSRQQVDELIDVARKRGPVSAYGAHASDDLYAALDAHPVKGKRVLVVGTQVPWVEATLHVYGAKEIVTVDFNRLDIQAPTNWLSLDIAGLNALPCCFDALVSFSSLEHDGLGRYGDPINPFGDFRRMQSLKQFLRQDGMFFLSVPVGNDTLVFNAHRIYGPVRLPKLVEGWRIVGTYKQYKLEQLFSSSQGSFQQPLIALRRA